MFGYLLTSIPHIIDVVGDLEGVIEVCSVSFG